MPQLTENEKMARALRDLYATRYPITTWGLIWRCALLLLWLVTIVIRVVLGIPPTWLTPLFAVIFTVVSREVWDGIRRRRFDRWEAETLATRELNKTKTQEE